MALSPMMQQYLNIKQNHEDALLLFRLGDFYELFFDDAIIASRELELTLTGRDCGLEERAPMCGVPYHAVDGYVAKLIAKNYTVAIAEQTTQPNGTKGIVERDVVRVITSGTVVESDILEETQNNYICAVYRRMGEIGLAYGDISTGELVYLENRSDNALFWLNEKLSVISPSEIICNNDIFKLSGELSIVKLDLIPPFKLQDKLFNEEFSKAFFTAKFPSGNKDLAEVACGALMAYVLGQTKREINWVRQSTEVAKMRIDFDTRRNLELVSPMREHRTKKGTLFEVINKTSTAMGARMLRSWLLGPLNDEAEILARHNAVEDLYKNAVLRDGLNNALKTVYDISRLCGKISFGKATPIDLVSLGSSLKNLPVIKGLLGRVSNGYLRELNGLIDGFEDLTVYLLATFVDNPPALTSGGGLIREGANLEIDKLRNIAQVGKGWLAELEAKEREATGIKTLKTGFNKIFGYYIEITKQYADSVPSHYIRKQTTVNNERYITEELKKIEERILGAEDELIALEISLFNEVIAKIKMFYLNKLISASDAVAKIDALNSLATVAVSNRFCKPVVSDKVNALKIVDGRHAVVESISKDEFVPNDTFLDNNKDKILIITGPNMAGKSTYMRQIAIIILLAHIGSFVPARSAEMPIVDQIFTRVGASDDLAFGQSTFMVEMSEVANILKNATSKSFLVFDEIGRGTSTLDGLSIAWAVVEYLSKNTNAMSVFSTHYHELTELEGVLDGVKNYRISVREAGGTILFLRKIVRGGANKSFGVEVAEMAGLPTEVIERARELVKKLESAEHSRKSKATEGSVQLSLFASPQSSEIVNILKDISIDNLSPMKAFDIVVNLVEKASKI